MKIIHLIPAYKPAYIYGGPTMSVAMLCEALVEAETEHKIEVEVFTTTANGKSELDVKPGKKMIVDGVPATYFKRLTKDHTHFSPALLWALYKEIKELRTRSKALIPRLTTHNSQHTTHNTQLIIHIHSWWNLVSILSCWLAKLYQVPVVLTPRGMLTQYTTTNRNTKVKSVIHRFLGKKLLSNCHVHATSEKEKQDILKIINPKSITVIPNLVSLPLIEQRIRNKEQEFASITHNQQHITDNPFKLLFLSRIEEKKGLDILFEALAQIGIDWQLTIAGTGEENYVESLKLKAERLRINNNMKWIGHVNNKDKFQLMAQRDLLILTSYNENFANIVIESLSVGTPVLLSDQVGLADYVEINKLGWITTLNIRTIAHKINEAYLDDKKRSKIRDTAAKIISKDFNIKNLTSQYLSLYNSIL